MKKILVLIAVVAALTITSCKKASQGGTQNDTPAAESSANQGLASLLDSLCQAGNDQAVLELERVISQCEQELAETDPEGLAQFQKALAEVRQRHSAYLATLMPKQQGAANTKTDKVVGKVVDEVVNKDNNHSNKDISDVTATIDSMLNSQK